METCIFPLYEVEHGEDYRITVWPKQKQPVEKYLRLQGRFAHLNPDAIAQIQENVDLEWNKLVKKAGGGPC